MYEAFLLQQMSFPVEVYCRLTVYGAFIRYICPVHGVFIPKPLPINESKRPRNMSKGIPITQAAKRLPEVTLHSPPVDPEGRADCPACEVGRNKGSLVNIEDIQRWRGGVADVSMKSVCSL